LGGQRVPRALSAERNKDIKRSEAAVGALFQQPLIEARRLL